ncbi:epoxyqueuosine reductase [Methanobrevibacter sp. OttesenSCG-928-K11]|nr:epoxyqueuosine reductase [Methanobrevibacter sp. OttesenSCG-928-K11]MDL2270428.1 epoxyqueuosine reductase [Methanobrevibacter sp. OttesenSCG-928-I08]
MEEKGCCNQVQTTSCCSGSELSTDESTIINPKNPKKTISKDDINKIKEIASELGIVSIGYTKLSDDVFLNDDNLEYQNAIVLTMPIGMDIINEDPGMESQKLNDKLYKKFGKATYLISDELRKLGYETQVGHPREELTDFSTLGQDAGLGYIGKSGLLITPELASRVKVSAILTSIENLPFNEFNEYEWIREYCKRCSKCIKACPELALLEKEDKSDKAYLIEERCIGCSDGCTYCIESCPFYEKGYDWVKSKQDKIDNKLKK